MKRLGRPRRITVWAALVPLAIAAVGLLFATSEQTVQGAGLRSGHAALVEFVRSQDRLVRRRAAAVHQLQDQVDALTGLEAPRSARVARLRAAAAETLWAGGAEAMMLMDQRVISTSAVRCVGNTLILQGRVYSPPYVIQAIGDQSAMHQALDKSPQVMTYLEYVEAFGLGYDVTSQTRATFPAYAGNLSLSYARTQ